MKCSVSWSRHSTKTYIMTVSYIYFKYTEYLPVLGAMLGTKETQMSKTDTLAALTELTF